MRAAVFLSVVIMVVSATPLHGHTTIAAPTHAAMRTSRIVSHGLELSLSLPRRAYPLNAIVRVRVTLRNVSHRVIRVGTTSGPECAWIGPGVEVLDTNGTQVYPSAVPLFESCGPHVPVRPLAPGRTFHHTTFVVLRGALIRAVATVSPVGVIRSPPLHLTLTNEAVPILSVQTRPRLHLIVSPSNPAQSGAFYYQYSILCLGPAPGVSSTLGTTLWHWGTTDKNGSYTSVALCNHPTKWAFVGGWVDHPVATLTYKVTDRNAL